MIYPIYMLIWIDAHRFIYLFIVGDNNEVPSSLPSLVWRKHKRKEFRFTRRYLYTSLSILRTSYTIVDYTNIYTYENDICIHLKKGEGVVSAFLGRARVTPPPSTETPSCHRFFLNRYIVYQ